MIRNFVLSFFLSLFVAVPAVAQGEGHLRQSLEGTYVVLKMDMPATKEGVNLRADRLPHIERKKYDRKLARYGTSIHEGEAVHVTLIKVKRKMIEFQLGGGGYGSQYVRRKSHPATPKTEREEKLEVELAALPEGDETEIRKVAREELDEFRYQRKHADEHLAALAAEEQAIERQHVRERAATAGSRFNLRYRSRVPAHVLTPQGFRAVVAEYVDFSSEAAEEALERQRQAERERVAEADDDNEPSIPADAQAVTDLRKGLLWDEVVTLLGRPLEPREWYEGKFVVKACTFQSTLGDVEAEFVEEVLVRYTLTSR